MKFYGHGIVWNPKKDARLCKFIDGVFETEDEEVIKELIDRNYKHDGEEIKKPTLDELRELAKAKGIRSYMSMKYETLLSKTGGLK